MSADLIRQKLPFNEIMRLSLLGNYERLTAKRAHEIGLVNRVVPREKLDAEVAAWEKADPATPVVPALHLPEWTT